MNNFFQSVLDGIASPFIAKKAGVSSRYVREALALSRRLPTLSPEAADAAIMAFLQANQAEVAKAMAAVVREMEEA